MARVFAFVCVRRCVRWDVVYECCGCVYVWQRVECVRCVGEFRARRRMARSELTHQSVLFVLVTCGRRFALSCIFLIFAGGMVVVVVMVWRMVAVGWMVSLALICVHGGPPDRLWAILLVVILHRSGYVLFKSSFVKHRRG